MSAILQRKVADAQRESAGSDMSALRALRLSLARAGEDLLGLPLSVLAARQQRLAVDDLGEIFSDEELLIVLDASDGATGVAAVKQPLVSALVQQQTTGQVSQRVMEPREFTDTDAALCAPLIEDVLRRAAELVEAEIDECCFRDIRFGARGEDVRSVLLSLRAPRYRVFHLSLDIALGLHQGELVLALPDRAFQAETASENAPHSENVVHSPLLDVPAQVDAVLARFRLPLAELRALAPGDILPLTRDRLDDTALVSVTGSVLARGRLGQMNGRRAVRLMAPLPIPRAGGERAEASFDSLALQAADGTDDGAASFSAPQDEPLEGLEALSPELAAEQISELAGLSAEDLATPMDNADFPAPEIDFDAMEAPSLPTVEDELSESDTPKP